jgi:uncharacterized protein YbaP (TraB family)
MKKKSSLLWRLDHPDYAASSYVFGTVHVKAAFAFENLDQVYQAIHDCEAFAAELSLDEAAHLASLSKEVLATPQNHLPTVLSEKKYQKIRAQLLRAVKVDIQRQAFLRPMLLMNMLDEAYMPPATASQALDEYLWNFAKNEEKLMLGLEAVESQAALLNRLDPKEEVAAFLHHVKNISKSRKSVLQTIQWYEEGEIQKLYKATYRSLGSWRYILLKKRNHIMADRIDEIASQQNVFAAVGAAHLAGKEGVLRLLKLKGFQVKPVISN